MGEFELIRRFFAAAACAAPAADVRRRFAPETVARDVLRHVKRLARERREERANADGEL